MIPFFALHETGRISRFEWGLQMGKSKLAASRRSLQRQLRKFSDRALRGNPPGEAFGEDIGQNSWHTSDEQDRFLEWLDLSPGKSLLDVACGAGGPALRIAARTGCSVVGIDVHEQAVTTASSLASQRGLTERAEFRPTDAAGPLPFSDARFDAITCIDAINHFSDRSRVIAEWVRLLKVGGRLLFTDPITLTGPLTNAEIAVRSSAGFYLFVPHGYDESVVKQCGLRLLVCEDITANMAKVAEARRAALSIQKPSRFVK